MALSNFGELRDTCLGWLGRIASDPDLLPYIPDMIRLAEAELEADVDARIMNTSTAAADLTSLSASLPTDYGEVEGVYLLNADESVEAELVFKTRKEIVREISDTGDPCVYTIHGDTIEFYPVQDGTSTWQWSMEYKARPILDETDDASTNVLLTRYPNAYLYGTLKHSAAFLNEDGRAATWASHYSEAIEKIAQATLQSEAGTSAVSMPR